MWTSRLCAMELARERKNSRFCADIVTELYSRIGYKVDLRFPSLLDFGQANFIFLSKFIYSELQILLQIIFL